MTWYHAGTQYTPTRDEQLKIWQAEQGKQHSGAGLQKAVTRSARGHEGRSRAIKGLVRARAHHAHRPQEALIAAMQARQLSMPVNCMLYESMTERCGSTGLTMPNALSKRQQHCCCSAPY